MPSILKLAAFAAAALAALPAAAANSGGYRGPGTNGVFDETGLLKAWPDGGPKLLWERGGLGEGWSAVCVADGTVYTTGGTGSGVLSAFALDGRLKWRTTYGAEWAKGGEYAGTRATPQFSDGCVYVASGQGKLLCFDAAQGDPKWTLDVHQEYGGQNSGWGYNETPLIVDDLIIVSPRSKDDKAPPLVAVDKHTGKTVWKADPSPGDLSRADSSPILVERGATRMVVHHLWHGILACDVKTGRRIWLIPTDSGNPQPVYRDGYLLRCKCLKKNGSWAMLKVADDGSATELWEKPIKPGCCTHSHSVILDGKLFVFAENAFQCYDAETGELLKEHPSGPSGTVVAADGRLYFTDSSPKITLVEPTPDGFDVVGSFRPAAGGKKFWTHPVVADGRLFVRYRTRLAVYDVRAAPPALGWRNDGTGRTRYVHPPVRWSRDLNVLWKIALPGPGHSSPVAVGNKVLLTAEPSTLVCCDAATGRVLWQHANTYADAGAKGDLPPAPADLGHATPTPLVFGERVYVLFGTGVVGCYDLGGERKWLRLIETPAEAVTASPAMAGGTLVVALDHLVGLDPETGEARWRTPRPAKRLGGSPVTVRIAETDVVVTPGGLVIRAEDGKVLADGLPAVACASPVVEAGVAYVCGRRVGAKGSVIAAYRLPKQASEGAPLDPIWRCDEPDGPDCWLSPLVHDGLLYALSAAGNLRVFEAATGQEVYRHDLAPEAESAAPATDRTFSGLALAGGRLYATNAGPAGRTVIFEPGRTFSQVWQYAAAGCRSNPAFQENRQYVRAGDRLWCIGGTEPTPPQPVAALDLGSVEAPEPGQGAPVQTMRSDKVPDAWVFAGPIKPESAETDFLGDLGGRENARPTDGAAFKHQGKGYRFQPLLKEHRWHMERFTGPYNTIDVTAVLGRDYHSTVYFYTVVRVDRPCTVRYEPLTPGLTYKDFGKTLAAKTWLAGRRVMPSQYVRFAKGCYGVLIQTALGEMPNEWGRAYLAPRFVAADDAFAADVAAYEKAARAWPAYQASLEELFALEP